MNDEVAQIKERLDIVEVIGGYLRLKRAGVNYKASCPFHNEKTPSFMVSPERQTFKCFGCGEGGDIYTFIEKIEGIDFYNALKLLADRAGIKLKTQSIKRGEIEYKSDRKTRLYEINNWAKRVYHKILLDHPKGETARQYLRGRGISIKTIINFEIGYAPKSWDLIIKFLKKKGYSVEEITASGIAVRGDKGDYYDRFRGRIVYPINNIIGVTIAFTSRVLKDEPNVPKYINSSESPIYIKGKTLYGLDKAKLKIKESDLAVFVEGNMDVITCHQAGFTNVVASSGTAITADQIKILSRYTSTIAFALDSDSAGEAAMKKAVIIALGSDINSKIVSLPPPYKDPDEAIMADAKIWQKSVEGAKNSLEAWIDLLVRKSPDLSLSTKKKITKEILPVIKIIYSPIEKEYYLNYLAKKLSLTESSLVSALEQSQKNRDFEARQAQWDDLKPTTKLKNPIIRIAAIGWNNPKLIIKYKKEILRLTELKTLFPDLYNKLSNNIGINGVNEKEKDRLNELALSISNEIGTDEEVAAGELEYQIQKHQLNNKERLRQNYAKKISEAEKAGDRRKLKTLLAEFSRLIK